MNPRRLLECGFVACGLIAALAGLAIGISCELRQRPSCQEAWDQGIKGSLAAGGALATGLAKFGPADPN